MKRVASFLTVVLLSLAGLNAELKNLNPDPNGEPWIVGGVTYSEEEMEWYNSLPVFTPTSESKSKELPDFVDNSTHPFFRSIFSQGYFASCAQASTIGYAFTYEINRLKDQSVIDIEPDDHEQYRFPSHFTYNFWNKGNRLLGSFISNAVTTSREFGVPNCSIWRDVTKESSDQFANPPRWESPMDGNHIQWMTGYDRYYNAMQSRTLSSQRFGQLYDASNLEDFKHYLNDHGDGSDIGGVAVFTMNFKNIEYALYPDDSPEAGKVLIKDTSGYLDHAMTIVGYNDLVKFDFDGKNGYTNDIDINGDGLVTMADWEIGALKIANSHGTTWPPNQGGGFCYLPYKLLAEYSVNMLKITEVTSIEVESKEDNGIEMAYKVTVDHDNRKLFNVNFGVTEDLYAESCPTMGRIASFGYDDEDPGISTDILPMQGYNTEPMEFGIDITDRIGYLPNQKPVKYFLELRENDDVIDDNNLYDGIMNNFSIIDYRNDNELCIDYWDNTAIGQMVNVGIIYDILPQIISVDLSLFETTVLYYNFYYNIGIPQTTNITEGAILNEYQRTRFFLHDTDLNIINGSLVVNNTAYFHGYDDTSIDRIQNYSNLDILGYLRLHNCDLNLFAGSNTYIHSMKVNDNSNIFIENGAEITFYDNSNISFSSEARIIGDITTTYLETFTVEENSVLNLEAGSDFNFVSGTTLILKANAKLIVENGSNLVFEEGSKIELEEGSEIIVMDEGKLYATGVSFSYTGSTGKWLGINCESGSFVDMNNVYLSGAETGVKSIGNYKFNITNSTFEGCINGIDLVAIQPGLDYIITDNTLLGVDEGRGISITSSDGIFSRNIVSHFNTGVSFILNSPAVSKNEISYNKYWGITIRGTNAIPLLVNTEQYQFYGELNNTIQKNGYVNNTEIFPSAQIGINPYASVYMRYNDVISSISSPGISICKILNDTAPNILVSAQYNYWGTSEVTDDFFSMTTRIM